ncbi:hypothetical protein A2U01_0080192, partial [Trifolium medium]|nr:hypothetical protein [Trifolium medium]
MSFGDFLLRFLVSVGDFLRNPSLNPSVVDANGTSI